MAHKRKGQVTVSPEWAKHLRPLGKAWFRRAERRAETTELRKEVDEGVALSQDEEI